MVQEIYCEFDGSGVCLALENGDPVSDSPRGSKCQTQAKGEYVPSCSSQCKKDGQIETQKS